MTSALRASGWLETCPEGLSRLRSRPDRCSPPGCAAAALAEPKHPDTALQPADHAWAALGQVHGPFLWRINHGVPNKPVAGDNEVSVVGGRNFGDEYFDAGARCGRSTWISWRSARS